MTGYSGTPLAGDHVGLLAEPEGFIGLLEGLPDEVTFGDGPADLVILFATNPIDLEERFSTARKRLRANGAIWVGWPKQSSPIPSDLVENDLRELLLPTGLVDNKVCAIDSDWSGLRFVIRKENRPAWPGPQ